MRMRTRRFTRLTDALSKKVESHAAMVAIHTVRHTSVRIHRSPRATPAMAAGMSDRLWSMEDWRRRSTRKPERRSRVALQVRFGKAAAPVTVTTGWQACGAVAHDAPPHTNMTVHMRRAMGTLAAFPPGRRGLVAPRRRCGRLVAGLAGPGRGAAGVRFDVLLVAADGAVRRVADAFRLGDG